MNNIELEKILKDKSLDVLEKIFDYMAEDLAKISDEDKIKLEKINNEMGEQLEILKQEFNELKADKVSKLLSDYICARDYISAYYNQKYFKERSKNRNKINHRINKITD